MATLTVSQAAHLAYSYGEQRADKDIARKVRLAETDCAANDDYQTALGHGAVADTQDGRLAFEMAFAAGYNKAFELRENMVHGPDRSLDGQIMRACYGCRARFCKPAGTAAGREYEEAAVIICAACIERMAEVTVSQRADAFIARVRTETSQLRQARAAGLII